MSGSGKSSVISNLKGRGYIAIDTDYDNWKTYSEDNKEWLLNEQKLTEILKSSVQKPLIISGCCSNQAKFYTYFHYVVLLSAPIETLLDRVLHRETNAYGQTTEERNEIIWNYENIQPLLKNKADIEYNTEELSVEEISNALIGLIQK
jgi:broad-specificity NMP kinase